MSEETNFDKNRPLSLRRFNILSTIGKGAFGSVKAIEDKESKKRYALKFISKRICIREKSTMLIFKERILLQAMSYPYIVSLRYAFQDDDYLFMVIDLALGGDLRHNMQRNPEFDEYTLMIYVAEISSAINYMHSRMVIHRDLKPENLLLTERGHILVTDFNLAASVEKRKPSSQSGTLEYMAPEMHDSKPYSYQIDWWALGTIFYELIYRKLPFGGKTAEEIITRTKTAPLIFGDMSHSKRRVTRLQEREDFITRCLERDPSKRLGSSNGGRGFDLDVKRHPYMSKIDWVAISKQKLEPKYKPSIEKDVLSIPASVTIEEMLTGEETLEYKPRKIVDPNKKTLSEKIANSFSNLFGARRSNSDVMKPPKPKSRKQLEREQMDEFYIEFDYQKPNQQPMQLPPSEKELKKQKEASAQIEPKHVSASATTILKVDSATLQQTVSGAENLPLTRGPGEIDTKIIKGAPVASMQITIPNSNKSEISSSSDLYYHPLRGHAKQQSAVSLVSVARVKLNDGVVIAGYHASSVASSVSSMGSEESNPDCSRNLSRSPSKSADPLTSQSLGKPSGARSMAISTDRFGSASPPSVHQRSMSSEQFRPYISAKQPSFTKVKSPLGIVSALEPVRPDPSHTTLSASARERANSDISHLKTRPLLSSQKSISTLEQKLPNSPLAAAIGENRPEPVHPL